MILWDAGHFSVTITNTETSNLQTSKAYCGSRFGVSSPELVGLAALGLCSGIRSVWWANPVTSWPGRDKEKRPGPCSPLQGTPPMTCRPPVRPRLLKVHPLPIAPRRRPRLQHLVLWGALILTIIWAKQRYWKRRRWTPCWAALSDPD